MGAPFYDGRDTSYRGCRGPSYLTVFDISSNLLVSTTNSRKEPLPVEYAILATLWNEPAGLTELIAAVCDQTGCLISPIVVDSHLRILEQYGFVERVDARSPYRLAERGSIYLAHIA